MDGLSIRNSGAGVQGLNQELTGGASTRNSTADSKGPTFGDTLKDAMNSVNTLQKESDTSMQQLATGKAESMHETMIAAEKADIALRLMVQVRNKVIDAYNDIMKMQV